jgi:hypothetical protein
MKNNIISRFPILTTLAITIVIFYIAPVLLTILIFLLIAVPIYLTVRLFGR